MGSSRSLSSRPRLVPGDDIRVGRSEPRRQRRKHGDEEEHQRKHSLATMMWRTGRAHPAPEVGTAERTDHAQQCDLDEKDIAEIAEHHVEPRRIGVQLDLLGVGIPKPRLQERHPDADIAPHWAAQSQ